MSDAVGMERISKIVGYKIQKGDFKTASPHLPQRIAILAEANEANQATMDTAPREITSAQQAGNLYGFGSPVYHIMRILRPVFGGGIGGIPTVVYPQLKASGAVQKVLTVTPVGTATANATHTLIIAGRRGIDSELYQVNIAAGDDETAISGKMADAVNAVLGAPVISQAGSGSFTLTSKWAGLTANDITVTVDTDDNPAGITYSVTETVAGTGTPDISEALRAFGNDWNTIVINSYGTAAAITDTLEAFNGIPDPVAPTGRYSGIVMKPFVALTGSVEDDPTDWTDARKEHLTIALCPAPGSKGLPMEAAANMAALLGRIAQNNPHLDVSGQYYSDMPVPPHIGSMADYENRDVFVKKGAGTVDLVAGRYKVMDFVTTYHPTGEIPPQFRYVRNLVVDFNIRYGYYLLEQSNVVDHAIATDDDTVMAQKVIKPKQWVAILHRYAVDLAQRGLIADLAFMQNSIRVNISTTNPDRLETFFRYKRTGIARIASTTAEAGFNFGKSKQ